MSFLFSARRLLLALTITLISTSLFAGVRIVVSVPPPALPVYEQPPCPEPGMIWTPGYWAWGAGDFYWVRGAWVPAPYEGALWTPPYWGWSGGRFIFHEGYWGRHIGYYGGVNYGFGYGGVGYQGGYWNHGAFNYNRSVNNVNVTNIHNVYNRTVINNTRVNHVSYNGGTGGISARPSQAEETAAHEQHRAPEAAQTQHVHAASTDHALLASVNHGRPGTMASSNVNAYHQTALQHAQAQPVSAADREAGSHYNPNNREANQDQRIANGERSGQMTSGEAARADRTQPAIDKQVHDDRVANGGKLTGQERQQINQEQNAASKQIYDEKHNGNTVQPNEVNNREANQHQRTANGLRSGQMTSGEAARSNRNQAALDQQVHNDRVANGGKLTGQERRQINQERDTDDLADEHLDPRHAIPPDVLVDVEQEQIVREAISRLPPRCREMIELLFFAQPPVPYNDVARHLHLATGSIGFIRGRCLKRLKKLLEEKGF